MKAAEISSVMAWEALDSRGRPTVGCRVVLAGGATGRALAPSGASTGGHEAIEVRDGGERYAGYGTRRAIANLTDILTPAVIGLDATDTEGVDAALEAVDEDPLLGGVGANAVLAVSLASTIAAAAAVGTPLFRFLGGNEPALPMPMVNIISGGAHAAGALDIQDVLVVPMGATTFTQALEWASRARAGTAEVLRERGFSTALVADEGGLSPTLSTNEEALAAVVDGIARTGLTPGVDVAIAIDIAANQFWDGTEYRLNLDDLRLTPGAWLDMLRSWCARYPIVSLEDILTEDDWGGWRTATSVLGESRQILGDDLFATNISRLDHGIQASVANAVLVKPNQAGTLSRAKNVSLRAKSRGYATVVSARSGDTEDDWLADVAVGWNSGQIKVGSTMRSERTAKWNRLLEIEALDGSHITFAKPDGWA